MSTRLDRLFCLLQDGQNPLVRETAAQQIGEICKTDVSKADVLLERCYQLLFSDEWESRTAAGQVIEQILHHIPCIYNPADPNKRLFPSSLTVQGYDIERITSNAAHLVQSAPHPTTLDIFLKHQYVDSELVSLLLLQRIGLISDEQLSTLSQLQKEYMLQIDNSENVDDDNEHKMNHSDFINNNDDIETTAVLIEDGNNDIDLNQLNVSKIETYLESLRKSKSENDSNSHSEHKEQSSSTKLKDEDFKLLMTVRSSLHPKHELSSSSKSNSNSNSKSIISIQFSDWYFKLVPMLLHSDWKYRHGAAIGLRSILKSMKSMNITNGLSDSKQSKHCLLTEGSLICVTVLLLDRFFDFQSDVTVAPICETVAQCLSLLLKWYTRSCSTDSHFTSILKLLLQCLNLKIPKTWTIRYSACLALKYVVPLHHETISTVGGITLIQDLIAASCRGLEDTMEDVVNMAAQVLLSNISLFIVGGSEKEMVTGVSLQRVVFESLLGALREIDDYSSSTMGVLSVVHSVLDEFPDLVMEYIRNESNDKSDDMVFANLCTTLVRMLSHRSMEMKKQAIRTLQKMMEFMVKMKGNQILSQTQILSTVQALFEVIVCEQNQRVRHSIEVLKGDDDDEYTLHLRYTSFIKEAQTLWHWMCQHLHILAPVTKDGSGKLPMEYQQMMLKLFGSFQKYCTFTRTQKDSKEQLELPTPQLIAKIEAMKHGENGGNDVNREISSSGKKRKRDTKTESFSESNGNMEPPVKKRRLNQLNGKSGGAANSTNSNIDKSDGNKGESETSETEISREIILWDIIDGGCKLLAALFTEKPFYPLGWPVVLHLLTQFLQIPKPSKPSKAMGSTVYGWRRTIGLWLANDCFSALKQYESPMTGGTKPSEKETIFHDALMGMRDVTDSDFFKQYDEMKRRRKLIQHHTEMLIETFRGNQTVYKEMKKYFKDLPFAEYVTAVTTKYAAWKGVECEDEDERARCYQLLLSTVLNAQYDVDAHGLSLNTSISNTLIHKGHLLKDHVNAERILQPILTTLRSTDKPNLQYRAAESLAVAVKLLCDDDGKDNGIVLNKIVNQLVEDCRDNLLCSPKDSTRMTVQCIVEQLGEQIFEKVPFLHSRIVTVLQSAVSSEEMADDEITTDWIPMAQIFACLLTSNCSAQFREQYYLNPILPALLRGLYIMDRDEENPSGYCTETGICAQARYCVLQCLYRDPAVVLPMIIREVIPRLEGDHICERLGAVELIWDIISSTESWSDLNSVQSVSNPSQNNRCARYLDLSQWNVQQTRKELLMQIIPYLSSLIVPLLRSITDFDPTISERANQIFSISVRLIPLEQGLPDPDTMPSDLKKQRAEHQLLLKQLVDPSSIEPFKCPFTFNAKLREYQQDGLNWLWFLHRFHLHGILADDMGLGKTLQSLLLLTSSHLESGGKGNTQKSQLRYSLIVCPATLVWHWPHEMDKFVPNMLTPLVVEGSPKQRRAIYSKLNDEQKGYEHNGNEQKGNISAHPTRTVVVIMSYQTMRNDIEYLVKRKWNYCILDEGHLIKNPKAKVSIAVKRIPSEHRLILSGTPIQNNVLDLWSLFDFLMPGFLGNQRWFKQHFSGPIQKSYRCKSGDSTTQKRGALKLEQLHKQVLPFIMRRLKGDVLRELPPKIIQDVEVDMHPIQRTLYQHFVNSGQFDSISNAKSALSKSGMQSLLFLRRLTVHPKLVLTKEHPLFRETLDSLQRRNESLEGIAIAPKFKALQSLIEQCNLDGADRGKLTDSKMLIFCQYKEVIALIENMLLETHYPDLEYRTLTGSLSSSQRFEVVKEFNRDPAIKILLLTVSVGGLGLNLNTADTVVFMEHDWNPMKDLQAMDRAHRIGQKKTVHVFRIIVRNTIEWEIMNKQRFKEHVANTVISTENRSLSSMASGTGSILDLFNLQGMDHGSNSGVDREGVDSLGQVRKDDGKQKALDSMLENLTNMTLIDEQYSSQFDLKKFIHDLK